MTRPPVGVFGRRPRALLAQRLARLPGRTEAVHFLRQLHGPTRRSAVRALVDGVAVTITLKRRGARPLFTRRDAADLIVDPARSIQVAEAVDAAFGLLPVSPTCLRRSVTLLRELHRLRLTGTMHVGVRTVADAVEAHAWVQTGDVVVNDDPKVTTGYVELAGGDLERLLPLLE